MNVGRNGKKTGGLCHQEIRWYLKSCLECSLCHRNLCKSLLLIFVVWVCGVPMTVTGVPAPCRDLQVLKIALSIKRRLVWDSEAHEQTRQPVPEDTWHSKTQQCCPLLNMQCVSLTQRFQSFASFPHDLVLFLAREVTISWAFTCRVDSCLLVPIQDTSWIGNKLLLNGFSFLPLFMNSSCKGTAAAASSSFVWIQLCCF